MTIQTTELELSVDDATEAAWEDLVRAMTGDPEDADPDSRGGGSGGSDGACACDITCHHA